MENGKQLSGRAPKRHTLTKHAKKKDKISHDSICLADILDCIGNQLCYRLRSSGVFGAASGGRDVFGIVKGTVTILPSSGKSYLGVKCFIPSVVLTLT